jgi:hypothetical protein
MGFLPEVDAALTAASLTTLKRNFGLAPKVACLDAPVGDTFPRGDFSH